MGFVCFGTYNTQNNRNGGLNSSLHRMDQGTIDLVLLQETKITGGVYAQESVGFHVVVLEAPSCHGGDVELFYKQSLHFSVEDHQQHEPNVISF